VIRPIEPEPIRLGGRRTTVTADANHWREAYYAKLADFAAETRRTSTLIIGLTALGCRATSGHPNCPGCAALAKAGAIDTTPAPGVAQDAATPGADGDTTDGGRR